MNARAYYNENDPFACAHLRELMADGLICDGDVDERSVEDVRPSDLRGFTQCHFFAGIGIWSLALRQSGWPDDRPVWSGSCPCPPFSSAGKTFRCPVCDTASPVPNALRTGAFNCVGCDHEWQADSRHLFPEFFRLIRDCRPAIVVGEQVSSKDGITWIDIVRASLEMVGYTVGHTDTPAAGFGAPHIRQRLYFGAKRLDDTAGARHIAARIGTESEARDEARLRGLERGRDPMRLADASGEDQSGRRILGPGQGDGASARPSRERSSGLRTDGGLADASRSGQQRPGGGSGAQDQRIAERGLLADECGRPGPTNGLWRNADWLFCRDGKWRPVEPGTFPLADAGTFRNRVAELRGAGNAINLAQATGFLEAFRESIDAKLSTEALDHV